MIKMYFIKYKNVQHYIFGLNIHTLYINTHSLQMLNMHMYPIIYMRKNSIAKIKYDRSK